MINKIQKYLLLKFPLLWNIRLVPMLLILAVIHLIFFAIGYFSTNTEFFNSYYYYSYERDLSVLYFVCVLVGILLLIGWLVFYSRNNGFKNFYPLKSYHLYLEWLMIFVISAGICLLPFSLTKGYSEKWKGLATIEETNNAFEILEKVHILIPGNIENYRYNSYDDSPIPIPDEMLLKLDSLDLSLYETEYSYKDGIIIKGYTGPSLLFGKVEESYSYYYYYDDGVYRGKRNTRKQRENQVKEWLRTGQKDSIYALMTEFEKLQRKHNLKVVLTPDKWLKRIYHPPFFPVNNLTAISGYQPDSYSSYNDIEPEEAIMVEDNDDIYPASIIDIIEDMNGSGYFSAYYKVPYLQYNELNSGYNQIYRLYNKADNNEEWIALFCLCLAIIISVFVFSFRVTGGKQWLIAFVSTGVLIFTLILIIVAMVQSRGLNDEEIAIIFLCMFWIALFAGFLFRILYKIKEKVGKGLSKIYTNIFIWLLPCIMPLSYTVLLAYSHFSGLDYIEPKEIDVMNMFWYNIIFTIFAMFFMSVVIHRWKGTSDE